MLLPGTMVGGKYKILSEIGRGGTSTVYLALHERVNKSWAIKETEKGDPGSIAAERREIELMKRMKHPALPSIVDIIEYREKFLIVMDYIEGRTLEVLLREGGPQAEETVIRWGIQLCSVLSYLHVQEPPVIYRDMKPSNVMLKPDGTIMLIDLGAAREFRRQSKDTVALGTRGYAAPEQYEETGVSDPRTDIYSLGVMLSELLTGTVPGPGKGIRDLRPELSPGLEAVLKKCMEPEKEKRYQSCGELRYGLEHYREQDLSWRRREKRKLAAFVLTAALTLSCGLGSLFFHGLERKVRGNSYEFWLEQAARVIEPEEERTAYGKAIRLAPGREEAWMGLLKKCFLSDQLLSPEEGQELRALLLSASEEGQTRETVFQKNQEGYARFAYEMGLAYFYKCPRETEKRYAGVYLKAAAEAEKGLSPVQRERAGKLGAIADYYEQIGQVDPAGDMQVGWKDYWADLLRVSQGNLVAEDNERTAIVVYREELYQLLAHYPELQKAGIPAGALRLEAERVRTHLDTDFEMLEETRKQGVESELTELRDMTRLAEELLAEAEKREEQL